MCGRFTQRYTWRDVVAFSRLGAAAPALNLRPCYNLAPSQRAAVVRADGGERRLALLRWGLIPTWAKEPRIGHRLINARAETVAQKPAFRAAYRRRRALVPVDGFYEWVRRGDAREPWLVFPRDRGLMAFAGLWERWRVPDGARLSASLAEYGPGDTLETFTVLTTEANAAMRPLHHRMPVILPPEAFGAWLSGGEVALGPAPDGLLAMHAVNPRVNSPRHDDPECVRPAASA